MSKKKYCKKCEPKPGKFIAVDDVRNPRCSSCGKELLEKTKKIEKIKIKEVITETNNAFAIDKMIDKINEIIEAFNAERKNK